MQLEICANLRGESVLVCGQFYWRATILPKKIIRVLCAPPLRYVSLNSTLAALFLVKMGSDG